MDNLESTTPSTAPAPANNSDLQAQVDSLRGVISSALILLLVVSGTLNIFFWRQFRLARADLNAIKQQASPMIAEYQQNNAQKIDAFLRQVIQYGKAHPDFAPIMNKYGLNSYTPLTNTPSAAPAIPTSSAPKKK